MGTRPVAMGVRAKPGQSKLKTIWQGGVLQCLEAATLGMPFEVWKTRMGRFRNESTMESFRALYKEGGVGKFWQGTSAKMVESATKGGVLLLSKESIKDSVMAAGISQTPAGFIAGAGGGICQVSVMGPCTFLVTAVVTGAGGEGHQGVLSRWISHCISPGYQLGLSTRFHR